MEKELCKRIADGDEAAFASLFNRYYPLLRPFILKFTRSADKTEEMLQETFMRVWLNRDQLPEVENLRAWIFTIASRQCLQAIRTELNHRRKLARLQTREETRQEANTPFEFTQLAEISRLVSQAVNNMPPQRQRIYRMSREQGLKPAAIAEALSLSVTTVKNALVTALKDIRNHLGAAGHTISLVYFLVMFF
ncbi:RNA polymerase sigma-70 factor [Longitalea arenae]|uniref:RNA polymerase sigma-70 factor n=1 Tax=Longitalea arenae TaxID=2812558 RepID=UPI0019674ECB|nr:RNA polymerase sigma-70 factor [Longitalea arenae]